MKTTILQAEKVGDVEGWVRVFPGPESVDSLSEEHHGTLVSVQTLTTSGEICRSHLGMSPDSTLWAQYGAGPSWRLTSSEAPLLLQELFLRALGYEDPERRKRMGIDPELRHLLRFHTGPSEPQGSSPSLLGFPRAARLFVLKGLVVPRWRRRAIALLGSRLLLFPEAGADPELELELKGGRVEAQVPRGGCLVLRVIPGEPENNNLPGAVANNKAASKQQQALFLGFQGETERDLWLAWLTKACDRQHLAAEDISPQDLTAESRLCLARSGLRSLPAQLLSGPRLTVLDIRDNLLTELPNDIWRLKGLQEMRLDRNALRELPDGLVQLHDLHTLSAAQNRITTLPAGLLGHMEALRSLTLNSNLLEAAAVSAAAQKPIRENGNSNEGDGIESLGPLSHVDLRGNSLSGSIVLADYGALTSLDVGFNKVQSLDLAALEQLRRLHCASNELRHLALSGRSLEVLVATNNKLQMVQVEPPPSKLQELDLSRNELTMMPSWLVECRGLSSIDVSHNQLTSLPEVVFLLPHLHTLQAGHNSIRLLPTIQNSSLSLQILRLQSNVLAALPPHLLNSCTRLVELNLSSNRLMVILDDSGGQLKSLRRMLASNNQLGDAALRQIARIPNLKSLHLAHNRIAQIPEICIDSWSDLHELVLSGNQLTSLPESITNLRKLQVLRVHSNQIRSCPVVNQMLSLKVLDLSHNRLEHVDLARLAPPGLQCLDISCNFRLHVDPSHFNQYRSKRAMSLVDTSGQNRSCLPMSPYHEAAALELPWTLGFAEAGAWSRFPISQLRIPAFCNTEALLGIFEGSGSSGPEVSKLLAQSVPRLLLEERTLPETAHEYMKYTILSAHRELRQKGQLSGANAVMCHISRPSPTKPYTLRVASVGPQGVLLARIGGSCARLTKSAPHSEPNRILGQSSEFPLVIPDPFVTEVVLGETDQFLIGASEKFWDFVPEEEAVREVSVTLGTARGSKEANTAAKRLVDLAQGYGCNSPISVLVLSLLGEGLRPSSQSVRVVSPAEAFVTQARSSPSGQSAEDDPGLEHFSSASSSHSVPLSRFAALPGFSDMGGDAEDELTDTGSYGANSAGPEQLRCWEYMLEKNSRVLFDRDLQAMRPTLPRVGKIGSDISSTKGSMRNRIAYAGHNAAYFGSLQRLLPTLTKDTSRKSPAFIRAPSAEMLQYVPEEDFGEIDPLQCSRMQRYWGVATTEL
ncbi:protein phosphatase PHLPP-like protein isoform X2 [Neocloeon triangulifer]|uniref:protein phosphatase PHLPP-like protein isoform X2 n=1 Tax=Neocloeon triangulifer TaxID=2078957 RepID=UPI00286EE81D|nr:protein phosphatase PHLPP-like protein isoform X2 [Neocloeon triangulifer]